MSETQFKHFIGSALSFIGMLLTGLLTKPNSSGESMITLIVVIVLALATLLNLYFALKPFVSVDDAAPNDGNHPL